MHFQEDVFKIAKLAIQIHWHTCETVHHKMMKKSLAPQILPQVNSFILQLNIDGSLMSVHFYNVLADWLQSNYAVKFLCQRSFQYEVPLKKYGSLIIYLKLNSAKIQNDSTNRDSI